MLDLSLYGWAVALGVVCAICSGIKFLIHCAIRPDEEGVHATVVDIWNDVNIESICFRYDTGEVARLPARKSVRRSLHVGQTGTLRVYKNRWFRDFTPDP